MASRRSLTMVEGCLSDDDRSDNASITSSVERGIRMVQSDNSPKARVERKGTDAPSDSFIDEWQMPIGGIRMEINQTTLHGGYEDDDDDKSCGSIATTDMNGPDGKWRDNDAAWDRHCHRHHHHHRHDHRHHENRSIGGASSEGGDQCECECEQSILSVQKLKQNRSHMAILHFLITVPRWSFSFFLWVSTLVIPLTVPQRGIQRPLDRLHSVIQSEADAYVMCVKQSFHRLDAEREVDFQKEAQRIQHLQRANAEAARRAEAMAEHCERNSMEPKRGLVEWRNNGMPLKYVNESMRCSHEHLQATIAMLGDELHDAESDVISEFNEYLATSESSLHRVAAYAQDRTTYDVQYFVTERISPALRLAREHSTASSFEASISYPHVELRIADILKSVEKAMNQSVIELNIVTGRADDFLASINELELWYEDMYGRLVDAHAFVIDLLPPGVRAPEYFDTSGIPISASLLPRVMMVPTPSYNLATSQQLIQDAISQLRMFMGYTIDGVELQSSLFADAVLDNWTDSVKALLSLDDYNPPSYSGSTPGISSPLGEIEVHKQVGVDASIGIESGLDGFGDLVSSSPNITIPTITIKQPEVFPRKDNGTSFSYLHTSLPRIVIPDIVPLVFGSITSHTWIPEVLFQAFRLWRLERIYSSGAIPDLPLIDFGIGDQLQDQATMTRLFLAVLMRAVASPWIVLLLMALPICLCVIYFWYPVVQDGCGATMDGTFLANDFFVPILVNEANLRGNIEHSKQEVRCMELSRFGCNQGTFEAQISFRNYQSALQDAAEAHNQSRAQLLLLDACVHDEINDLFQIACCGFRGYPDTSRCPQESYPLTCPIDKDSEPSMTFQPLSHYTSNDACAQPMEVPTLADPRIDCSKHIDSCRDIPCKGANAALIREETIKADCEVETYAVHCCQLVLLVLCNAVFVNIICTLFFRGLRQVHWRKLCPARLIFRTQVNEDGEIIVGDSIHGRVERIETAIHRFELIGRLQLWMAGVVFVLWIVFLVVVDA